MAIGSVILPDTTPEEWVVRRARIRERILDSMGEVPAEARGAAPAAYEETGRSQALGLERIHIRYHVFGEEWNEGVLILPEGGEAALPAPAVLAIHGTHPRGKESLLDPTILHGRRLFPIELARRGYLVLAVDQYGFGGYLRGGQAEPTTAAMDAAVARFGTRYPEWSLDGRRLMDLTRALDVLDALNYAQRGAGYGTIGNSLGGRGVIFLTALDERVGAAVCSTGISTHAANVHRMLLGPPLLSRRALDGMKRTGRLPWEYHEMIALCAPRALMVIEPYNDDPTCNPDVYPNLQCLYQASQVYRLLGRPECLSLYLHGDGHDLVDEVRGMAYDWLGRFLRGSTRAA